MVYRKDEVGMMRGGLGRALTGNRGQTLVEFALVVALLLAILFGITEFGRAWFYSNHLNNSVRAAARYGAVLGSTPGGFTTDAVDAYLRGSLNKKDPTFGKGEIGQFMDTADIASIAVNVYPPGVPPDSNGTGGKAATDIQRGDTIEVVVTYNFHVLSGSIIPFFRGNTQLIRSATMRYEG
jgi:Flp pilus assembly protein TadG